MHSQCRPIAIPTPTGGLLGWGYCSSRALACLFWYRRRRHEPTQLHGVRNFTNGILVACSCNSKDSVKSWWHISERETKEESDKGGRPAVVNDPPSISMSFTKFANNILPKARKVEYKLGYAHGLYLLLHYRVRRDEAADAMAR